MGLKSIICGATAGLGVAIGCGGSLEDGDLKSGPDAGASGGTGVGLSYVHERAIRGERQRDALTAS